LRRHGDTKRKERFPIETQPTATQPPYELVDHTADLGVRVFGETAEALFANAAYALTDLITDPSLLVDKEEAALVIEGSDWADLMVNWLRELLYAWCGHEKLVQRVRIVSLTQGRLEARVWYDAYAADRHVLRHEIKAVTYHQIRVATTRKGWEAQVIFDV